MAGRKPGCTKTGGRTKGSTNKKTIAKLLKIDEYCAEKGYDPLHALVDLATAPDEDKIHLDIKLACHKELAKYLYSQLSAIKHTGSGGGPIKIKVELHKAES